MEVTKEFFILSGTLINVEGEDISFSLEREEVVTCV